MTLVDTTILLDVLTNDPKWLDWSIVNLRVRANAGPLIINEVVYAEMSGYIPSETELDECVRRLRVALDRTPKSALFLAGETFRLYRRAGGVRTGVLPDFFIGAHAQVAGMPILTRDVRRYRTYFPSVQLITPDT
jgi:predicted nucleic acid-binding protein